MSRSTKLLVLGAIAGFLVLTVAAFIASRNSKQSCASLINEMGLPTCITRSADIVSVDTGRSHLIEMKELQVVGPRRFVRCEILQPGDMLVYFDSTNGSHYLQAVVDGTVSIAPGALRPYALGHRGHVSIYVVNEDYSVTIKTSGMASSLGIVGGP